MSVILFSGICGLIWLLGLQICIWLKRESLSEIWGLSWLLGMGWGTFAWFLLYHWSKVPFSYASLIGTLVGLNLIGWLSLLSWQPRSVTLLAKLSSRVGLHLRQVYAGDRHLTLIGLGWLVLLTVSGFVLAMNIFWPVTDWDSLALYDFRAKVMVVTGSLASGKELEYFFQYPLFTSALHASTYFSGLGVAKVWYAIIYHAFLVTFYSVTRKRTTASLSMTGTLFLGLSPLFFSHSFMAYTNLAYTAFASLGFMYLWQWWHQKKSEELLIGGMLVGLSTWVRISEPFYYVAMLVIGLGFFWNYYHLRSWKQLPSVIIAGLLVWFTRSPWDNLITSLYGENVNTPVAIASLTQTLSISQIFYRVGEVTAYLWKYSAPVYLYGALLAMALFILELRHRDWSTLIAWFSIASCLAMIFVGTLLLSFWLESWNRIGDSVARMSMLLVPLFVYLITISSSWIVRKTRR